jgi:hypothetical protein
VLPLCGRFRYGSSCVSLRPFVRSVTALRAFRYGRSCVPLRLFVRLGAHLANWPCIAFGCPSCQLALPCVAFGRTSCELALRCVRAPNLGEVVLKNLYLQAKIGSYPSSGSSFCLVLPLCGRFRYGSSCVPLRLFVRSVTALRAFPCGRSCVPLRLFVRFLTAVLANRPCIAFGCPSCQLALPCPWSPNLGQAPRVFRYGSSCVRVPMLRSRLALRLGAHLANSPCVAFGRPTLVRSY